MATGDIIKFGTMYLNGVPMPKPVYPWRGDNSNPTVQGAPAMGDIITYKTSSGEITIRDTYQDDMFKMQWVEINDEVQGKKLYIADRNYLAFISWTELNNQGLVFGKEFVIDGRRCRCRLMTIGEQQRDISNAYSCATPEDNEWDRFILNEGENGDLPTPSNDELISANMPTKRVAPANTLWNYWYMYSWGQETYAEDSTKRGLRGMDAVTHTVWQDADDTDGNIGWRPVLEVLNSAPLISDDDRDLGKKNAPFVISYSVTEGDGDTFEVSEYLNGQLLQTHTEQESGTEYTIDLMEHWSDMANATHTVKIIATDVHGVGSERTITFTKYNAAPNPPKITSHVNGQRMETSSYVEFTLGEDPEGDVQTLRIWLADDENFTSKAVYFSGLQEYANGEWVSASDVVYKGPDTRYRFLVTGQVLNKTRYMRIESKDEYGSGTSVYSNTVMVHIGPTLEVETKPFVMDFLPANIAPKASCVIDSKATIEVWACNNALDSEPKWERVTSAFINGWSHPFMNTEKTSDKWAVSMKFIVTANDANGEISISAIGAGVS